MAGENTTVYREQGGNSLIVDSGGTLEVKTGSTIKGLLRHAINNAKVASGSQEIKGNGVVNTGLTSIADAFLTLKTASATLLNRSPVVTWGATNASLTIYCWKHTSTSNPTLIPATASVTINYTAVGVA